MKIETIKSVFWSFSKNTLIPNYYYYIRNVSRLKKWREMEIHLIHIPKTAGISLSQSLGLVDPGHFTYAQLELLGVLNNKKEIWVTVRNPTDRMVSIYNYIRQTQPDSSKGPLHWFSEYKSLNEFIHNGLTEKNIERNLFLRRQVEYLPVEDDSRIVLIDFDRLGEEFNFLCKKNNIESRLPHSNKLPKFDIELSKSSLDKLKEIYYLDYQLYSKICSRDITKGQL